jgi:asparagine synthase (glutamine-hydrolysing)
MITGQGADELLDMLPFHLADMILHGRLLSAWSEARAWARGRGSTPWRILQLCALPELGNRFRRSRLARSLLPKRSRSLDGMTDWAVPAWINEDFARRYRLAERAAEADARMRESSTLRLALGIHGIQRRAGDPTRWMHAATRGIAFSHPFLDPRVVSLGLGLQEGFRPDPHQAKPVLAAAMRGSLPEPIRTRRDKRSFNEIYYLGLSRNVEAIKRMIEQAAVKDLDIFDTDAVMSSVEEAALGVQPPRVLIRLDTTLSAIAWLGQRRQQPMRWRRTLRVPMQFVGSVG